MGGYTLLSNDGRLPQWVVFALTEDQPAHFFRHCLPPYLCYGTMGLTKVLESASLGLPNRIAGAVFGMFKWSLMVGTCLMYLNRGALELIPKETTEQSLFYSPVMEMNDWIRTYIFQYKDLLPRLNTTNQPS